VLAIISVLSSIILSIACASFFVFISPINIGIISKSFSKTCRKGICISMLCSFWCGSGTVLIIGSFRSFFALFDIFIFPSGVL